MSAKGTLEPVDSSNVEQFMREVNAIFLDLTGDKTRSGMLKDMSDGLYNNSRPKKYPSDAPTKQDFISLRTAINTLKRDFNAVAGKRMPKKSSSNSGFSRYIKLRKDSPLGRFVGVQDNDGYWYVTPSVATQVVNVYINLNKDNMVSEEGRSHFRPDDTLHDVLSPYYAEVPTGSGKKEIDPENVKYTDIQRILHTAYRIDEVGGSKPKTTRGKKAAPSTAPSDVRATLLEISNSVSRLKPFSNAVTKASKKAEDDYVNMARIQEKFGDDSPEANSASKRYNASEDALSVARDAYNAQFAKVRSSFTFK